MKKLTLALNSLLVFAQLSAVALAQSSEGSKGGGGGDASEQRAYDIRQDLLIWIKNGGSKGLMLPKEITLQQYNALMQDLLEPKKVVVTFTNEEIKVQGLEKTCRSFFDAQDVPHIECNIDRFAKTDDASQYRLIHHEFAGLASLEKNEGAASDYFISNQITDFLETIEVLRLSVKRIEPTVPCGLSGSIEERIKDCALLPSSKKGVFVLITRRKTISNATIQEVYKDMTNGLIWSYNLWSATYKEASKNCKKYMKDNFKDLDYFKDLSWRLPTIEEYVDANSKGIRESFRYMEHEFWSGSKNEYNYNLFYDGVTGKVEGTYNVEYPLNYRCVGKEGI